MSFVRISPFLPIFAGLGLLTGCANSSRTAASAISPATNAANFEARSLRDEGLRRFLADNQVSVPTDGWDFESLSWAAFYFNPSLELARAQWAVARAAERSAGVRPNPTLTLTPGYNFTRTAGVSPWMPAVNLDFLLPAGDKRAHQMAMAQNESEAARQAVFAAAWQLRGELRRALADASSASARAKFLRAQSEVQEKLLALLEQRRTAGSASATEVSLARAAQLRAEVGAADAAGQSAAARARVAAVLGLPLSSLDGMPLPTPLAPDFSPETLATLRREALQSQPEILAALAKVQAARAALELEVAKRVPEFHLGPGYQWDQGSNKWTLGLSFELPIFHHNEAAVSEATARQAEAAAQFNLVQSRAVAAIDAAVATHTAANGQLERARQLQTEVEKQSALVQQRFELGAADQVEVQTARLDAIAAAGAVADAVNAATAASGQLEDALQVPFPRLAALANATATLSLAP